MVWQVREAKEMSRSQKRLQGLHASHGSVSAKPRRQVQLAQHSLYPIPLEASMQMGNFGMARGSDYLEPLESRAAAVGAVPVSVLPEAHEAVGTGGSRVVEAKSSWVSPTAWVSPSSGDVSEEDVAPGEYVVPSVPQGSGTNFVFAGSNGGGLGFARRRGAGVQHRMASLLMPGAAYMAPHSERAQRLHRLVCHRCHLRSPICV